MDYTDDDLRRIQADLLAKHGSTPRSTPNTSSWSTPCDPEILEQEAQRKAKQEAHERMLLARKRFNDSGVPKLHTTVTERGGANCEPWNDAWKEASETDKTIIVLHGPRGTGKTQMAVELIRNAVPFGTALYRPLIQFFMDLKATYRDRSEQCEQDVIDEYRRPKLLVLDEIRGGQWSEWQTQMLAHMIDLRYGDMNRTVLITNLRLESMGDVLDASIISRCHETGLVIHFDWPSFRGAK